ncbi:MAG: DUF3592 domain-containing protein [Gemmatimonadota bacterium]
MAADLGAYRKWYPPFLTLAGFILCCYGLRGLGASFAITRWPVIPARVVQSAVDSVSEGGFRPRISYEFFLAGRRYLGGGIDRPATADHPASRSLAFNEAKAIATRYHVGQELLAGFDPENPSRTVLHPRFNWWTLAPVVLGALFGGFGVVIWRQRRRAIETVPTP